MYNNPYSPFSMNQPFMAPQFAPNSASTMPMQQQQSAPQTMQSGPDWLQVPNVKQVEQISVTPGGKAWIMVQNEPVFALRTADQMGLVSTTYYKFQKYEPGEQSDDYITRNEFDKFVKSVQNVLQNLGASKEGEQ